MRIKITIELNEEDSEEMLDLVHSGRFNVGHLLADSFAEFSKTRGVSSHTVDLYGAEEYMNKRYPGNGVYQSHEREAKIYEVAARCRASELLREGSLRAKIIAEPGGELKQRTTPPEETRKRKRVMTRHGLQWEELPNTFKGVG